MDEINKCMFCQPEEDAKDVVNGDVCDECAERGIKQGWLKPSKL